MARVIRRRVFFGCQGESERSYGTLLHRLVEKTHRLHIDAVPLNPGAGDPLATVERAVKLCRQKESQLGPYKDRAILLDSDQKGICPKRDAKVKDLADQHSITLLWQDPCHEGFLLRHFAECRTHQPITAKESMTRLRRCWPDYEKALPANRLEYKLNYSIIVDACEVESALAGFLRQIGFLPPEGKR